MHQIKTDKSLSWYPENLAQLSYEDYVHNCSLLQQLADVLHVHRQRLTHPWRPVKRIAFSPDFLERVRLTVGKLSDAVSQLVVALSKLEKLPHWSQIPCVQDAKRIFSAASFFKANSQTSPLIQNGFSAEAVEKFLGKCAEVEKIVAEYQRHVAQSPKTFRIPDEWQDSASALDLIRSEAAIDGIGTWNSTAAQLPDILKEIERLGADTTEGTGVNILHMPYDEVITLSKLFIFANELKGITGWYSLSALKEVKQAIEIIYKLNEEVCQREQLLQQYGVLEEDINRKKLQDIEQRFRAGYRTWLRNFSSQYRQDCAAVVSYCSLDAPKKHNGLRDLTLALSELERRKKYLAKCLLEFSSKHLKKPVDREDIQTLIDAIREAEKLMDERKIDTVPVDYQHLIEKCRKKTVLPDLAAALIALQPLDDSAKELIASVHVGRQPLMQRVTFLHTLKQQVESAVLLQASVSAHIESGKAASTLGELGEDAGQLQAVHALKKQVDELGFTEEFNTQAPASIEILETPDTILKYKDFAAVIASTFPEVDMGNGMKMAMPNNNKLSAIMATMMPEPIYLGGSRFSSDIAEGRMKELEAQFGFWCDETKKILEDMFMDFTPVHSFMDAFGEFYSETSPFGRSWRFEKYINLTRELDAKLAVLIGFYKELSNDIRSPLTYLIDQAKVCFYDFICPLKADSNEASLCAFMFQYSIGEKVEMIDAYNHMFGEQRITLGAAEKDKIKNAVDGINRKTNKAFGFPIIAKDTTTINLTVPARVTQSML